MFAATIAAAPRNSRNGIDWRSMGADEVADVFAAAVAVGDTRTERQAHRAGLRVAIRTLRASGGACPYCGRGLAGRLDG
jgi:hypothetical protein